MILELAGGAHAWHAPERSHPADQIGLAAGQRVRHGAQRGRYDLRIEERQMLPQRIGADDDRRADLPHQVRAVDGQRVLREVVGSDREEVGGPGEAVGEIEGEPVSVGARPGANDEIVV